MTFVSLKKRSLLKQHSHEFFKQCKHRLAPRHPIGKRNTRWPRDYVGRRTQPSDRQSKIRNLVFYFSYSYCHNCCQSTIQSQFCLKKPFKLSSLLTTLIKFVYNPSGSKGGSNHPPFASIHVKSLKNAHTCFFI